MNIMLKSLIFMCILSQIDKSYSRPLWNKYHHYLKLHSVELFREYVRIDTSKPENIELAVHFWIRQFKELGIPYAVYRPAGRPVVVATVLGSKPELPSIMLNSHMDVVPVVAADWKYPPFEAYMDINGDIHGRGTQDTKDIAIQYFEAIRHLKNNNITLIRTLHMTLMPDEETGGKYGMEAFTKTKEFKSLNVGFALDEGLPSTDDTLYATFVDKKAWQMQFVMHGPDGHGYKMLEHTAMGKSQKLINKVMEYRVSQQKILETKNKTDFTGYNSVNINIIHGGLVANIIPSTMTVVVDMRVDPDSNVADMEDLVQSWVHEAGTNVTELTYIRKELYSGVTAVDDTNPYWITLRNTLNNMGITIKPVICPATSDMIVIRNLGIPALGFSTKMRTKSKFHSKDEYQNVVTFVNGIGIYAEIIKSLGNQN